MHTVFCRLSSVFLQNAPSMLSHFRDSIADRQNSLKKISPPLRGWRLSETPEAVSALSANFNPLWGLAAFGNADRRVWQTAVFPNPFRG